MFWMFFFHFIFSEEKGLFAMQNVVTTRLLYLVFFRYQFSIYCLHIPSPTMLSVGFDGCFFRILLLGFFSVYQEKGLFAMQNVVTTSLYLVFFKPRVTIPSPTMLSVALIILPVFFAWGYQPSIQTKRFNGPVGVHCLLLS